jgi:hypothetical protein
MQCTRTLDVEQPRQLRPVVAACLTEKNNNSNEGGSACIAYGGGGGRLGSAPPAPANLISASIA